MVGPGLSPKLRRCSTESDNTINWHEPRLKSLESLSRGIVPENRLLQPAFSSLPSRLGLKSKLASSLSRFVSTTDINPLQQSQQSLLHRSWCGSFVGDTALTGCFDTLDVLEERASGRFQGWRVPGSGPFSQHFLADIDIESIGFCIDGDDIAID